MNEHTYMTTEHFECQCSSDEHTLKFTLDELSGDIEDLEIYTSVFLNQYRGFWVRLWTGIKYIFGYTSRYGHWDCFIMRGCDVDRMMKLLRTYKELEAKLIAKRTAEDTLEAVCNDPPPGFDIGQLPQDCGPHVNAPENFH